MKKILIYLSIYTAGIITGVGIIFLLASIMDGDAGSHIHIN